MSHPVYRMSTIDDLLAFAAEEISAEDDGDRDLASAALRLAVIFASIIPSQVDLEAQNRRIAAAELTHQLD